MTANQINYWKLMEEKRHNFVTEAETARYNKAVNAETVRYNKVVNAQNQLALEENKRHNLENELIGALQAKAGLASASAAQTSAAASYKQAVVRGLELEQQKYVDERVQNRQDALVAAQIKEYSSVVDLNNSKTSLNYVSAETEAARAGLINVQSALEGERINLVQSQVNLTNAQEFAAYAGATRDVVGTFTDVGKLALSVIPLLK